MSWDSIKNVVGTVAPVLGTLVGGPAGATIGGVIASVLGVEETPEAVEAELAKNPDALLKLKEYEYKHKEKLEQMKLDEAQMYIADVQNARSRQVEHEKATGKTDVNLYVLAWVIVGGFFGLIGTLIFHAIPTGQNEIIYMLFGTLSAGFGAVMQYFFGTSKGSSDKTKHLVAMGAKK